MGPKIASLYSSTIRRRGFCGDLMAIIMPASVRALLLVYACVCVPARLRGCASGSVDSADSRSKQWSAVPEARL